MTAKFSAYGKGAGRRVWWLVCVCALCLAAVAGLSGVAWAAEEGDGSTSGTVTSSDTDPSTSTATKSDAVKTGASKAAAAADGNGADFGDSADEAAALDAEGNEVDEGQTFDNSFLYDADIAELTSADSYYDNQTVQVTGEVVGDAIAVTGDGDHAWIVLRALDSQSTVTVLIKRSELRKIDTYGEYGSTGTILRVQGTFNLSCTPHEGETDIHATSVFAVKAGSQHADEFNPSDFLPGVVALGVGLLLWFVFTRMRERQR